MSQRMTPCSPISNRSQLSTSPSNSPSMRSVPETMRVPRKLEPTPRMVLGDSGALSLDGRERNFIIGIPPRMCGGWPRTLDDVPRFQQPLEILAAVILELDRAALTAGANGYPGGKALLELVFDLGDLDRPGGLRANAASTQLTVD